MHQGRSVAFFPSLEVYEKSVQSCVDLLEFSSEQVFFMKEEKTSRLLPKIFVFGRELKYVFPSLSKCPFTHSSMGSVYVDHRFAFSTSGGKLYPSFRRSMSGERKVPEKEVPSAVN